jgi:hypothetical protein
LLALETLDAEPARAIPIDLNLFYADSSVVIESDGSSATLFEDASLDSVLLGNDPFFGDPALIEPGTGVLLAFDYAFTETEGGDEFFAWLFEATTRQSLVSWFCDASCAGSALVDLTPFSGFTLRLEFQLSSIPPGDFDEVSTVRISNLDVGRPAVSVDEPSTLALLSLSSRRHWSPLSPPSAMWIPASTWG